MISLKCNLATSGVPHVGYLVNVSEVLFPNKTYASILNYVPRAYSYELFVRYYISDYFRRRKYSEYLWELISYLTYHECRRAFGPSLMKVANNSLHVWHYYIDGVEFMITCPEKNEYIGSYGQVHILLDTYKTVPYQDNITELRKLIRHIEKHVTKSRLEHIRDHYKIPRRT